MEDKEAVEIADAHLANKGWPIEGLVARTTRPSIDKLEVVFTPEADCDKPDPVSYTHLTLPTIYSV